MTQFAQAFGSKFNKDDLRVRNFEMNGHTFKVKVPLTIEFEAMNERMKKADSEKIDKYYAELTKGFLDHKEEFPEELGIVFEENDILIQGRSMKEAAENKAVTEARIVELFKLLVPEEKGFDMATITYDMIEELFPFSIQMEIIEKISDAISPTYKDSRGK